MFFLLVQTHFLKQYHFSKKQIFSNTLENFHTNYSIGRFKGGIPKNV